MQRVSSADGTEIGYERHGDGPAIACLHGTGVTRQIWLPLVPELAGDATLLVPDRRGRGASEDGDRYGFRHEIDDAVAVAETADSRILFGSSFGGLVAMAATQELDVDGLILYEPPMPAVTVDREYESIASRMEGLLAEGEREAAVKLFFREAAGAQNVEQWPIWPDCLSLAETMVRESAIVERFRPDGLDLSVPALLFTGEHSLDNLKRSIDVLETRIPDTRRVELEGVGHAGIASAPGQIATAVREFL
jgi:pimeloyl-ACP methyl ester carboxylesterase